MSFSDIFKKTFLDGFSSADISIYTASAALLVACCMGLYIFVVYRVLTRKTFYSKTFNISLAAITVITAAVIVTINIRNKIAFGLVFGGLLGNLLDRIIYGYVRDFISLQFGSYQYPIFNIADIAIVIGIIFIIIAIIKKEDVYAKN